MGGSTRSVIKNIHTLWCRKSFLLRDTYFPTNLLYSFALRETGINIEPIDKLLDKSIFQIYTKKYLK